MPRHGMTVSFYLPPLYIDFILTVPAGTSIIAQNYVFIDIAYVEA